MPVTLSPIGNGAQFFSATGQPLAGGLLNTYVAGSSTPAATYTTYLGNVANNNPIVLGSDGRPPSEIWLTQGTSYKLVLTDSLSNILATYDNISGIGDFNNLTAAGNTVLGGPANTLNVGSGALTVDAAGKTVVKDFQATGNVTAGDSNADILFINAGVITALNPPTVSGAWTWSGAQTYGANPAGNVIGSTYTPTLTNTTNITSSTANVAQYMRVGPIVTVSGVVYITPTAGPALTQLGMSLPIASNFTNAWEACAGTAVCYLGTSSPFAASITADTTNKRATWLWRAPDAAALEFAYQFTYRII
jgi:hypothetical protein